MELKYEAIGRPRLTKIQYWKRRAQRMNRMITVVSFAVFLLGLCIGLFLGTF